MSSPVSTRKNLKWLNPFLRCIYNFASPTFVRVLGITELNRIYTDGSQNFSYTNLQIGLRSGRYDIQNILNTIQYNLESFA